MWVKGSTINNHGYYIDKNGRSIKRYKGKWWHNEDVIETPEWVMDGSTYHSIRNACGNAYEEVFNIRCANGADYESCQTAGRRAAVFAMNDYVNREETLDKLMLGYDPIN